MPKFKKNPKPFERTEEGRPKEKIKIPSVFSRTLKYRKFNQRDYMRAKFLAKEVYITEAFINRISKLTTRQIIVVPIERTGVMYTISIPKNEQVQIKSLKYPSSKPVLEGMHNYIANLKTFIESTQNHPLFVFVDSSTDTRMPSALTGHIHSNKTYTKSEKSISGVLKSMNKNVEIANYDFARGNKNPEKDYLPRYSKEELNKIDAILFNPSKRINKVFAINEKVERWTSAYHDDRAYLQSKKYYEIVLGYVNEMKKSYSKMKK